MSYGYKSSSLSHVSALLSLVFSVPAASAGSFLILVYIVLGALAILAAKFGVTISYYLGDVISVCTEPLSPCVILYSLYFALFVIHSVF